MIATANDWRSRGTPRNEDLRLSGGPGSGAHWHLELSAGQYRKVRNGQKAPCAVKLVLVQNIVLSMPSPTPPEKVLAAARMFAREKFAAQHRYAMVLHND